MCVLLGVFVIVFFVLVIVFNFEFYYKEELSKWENVELVFYKNFNSLVLKLLMLEYKLLFDFEVGIFICLVKLDVNFGQYFSFLLMYCIINGVMKFGQDIIIEIDEFSIGGGGGSGLKLLILIN